jgi:hypothetical protein
MARLWNASQVVLLGFAVVFLVGADSPLNTSAFITPEQADAATLLAITPGNAPVVGWILRSEKLVLGLTQVYDATGKVRFSEYPAENAYVLYYTAPPQRDCNYIYAIAVARADRGGAGGADWQASCGNDQGDAYPGPGPNSTQPFPLPLPPRQ